MVSCIIQGIAGRIYRLFRQIGNSLDAKAAGNHENIFRAFRNHILQLLFCLGFVAQKINSCTARNCLSVFSSELLKLTALWFVNRFKFLEAFVTGNNEQIVLIGQ